MDVTESGLHEAARNLADAVAALRTNTGDIPEILADLPWHRLRTLTCTPHAPGMQIEASIAERQDRYGPARTRTMILGTSSPANDRLRRSIHDLEVLAGSAVAEVTVHVARPGWRVACVAVGDNEPQQWSGEDSLAILPSETEEFSIAADADDQERGQYVSLMLVRTAMCMRHAAAGMPEGLQKHWTMVDAEVMLRLAEREKPSLDPAFRPGLRLIA